MTRPAAARPRPALLGRARGAARRAPVRADPVVADPYGDDLQLALYCCYELHYRGFAAVPDDREWEPGLLALRRELERVFERALRADVPTAAAPASRSDRAGRAARRSRSTVAAPSWYLRRDGTLEQLREYVALRSLYHLKEADPQTWVIPRLAGPAKAALVEIQPTSTARAIPIGCTRSSSPP